jgi:hypothetical protein
VRDAPLYESVKRSKHRESSADDVFVGATIYELSEKQRTSGDPELGLILDMFRCDPIAGMKSLLETVSALNREDSRGPESASPHRGLNEL